MFLESIWQYKGMPEFSCENRSRADLKPQSAMLLSKQERDHLSTLLSGNYLFQDLEKGVVADLIEEVQLRSETLYSSRPVYTSFHPGLQLDVLYVTLGGGPVITRTTPLDRIISITYPGSCFGFRNLPLGPGLAFKAFPSLVEAYKTTEVIKIPLSTITTLYNDYPTIRERYHLLFEQREKFQYHILNCSTYPPQAVAALLRALIYQERALKNQPDSKGIYSFDLPIEVIARATQLNHRTVEQVLKGMSQVKLIKTSEDEETSADLIQVLDPEALKAVYSSTRDKVSWWPLRGK